jgi:hypothetical protein
MNWRDQGEGVYGVFISSDLYQHLSCDQNGEVRGLARLREEAFTCFFFFSSYHLLCIFSHTHSYISYITLLPFCSCFAFAYNEERAMA